MLRIEVNGESLLVTEADYRANYFGKVNHIHRGWEAGPAEAEPTFDPAPAAIFKPDASSEAPAPEDPSFTEIPVSIEV